MSTFDQIGPGARLKGLDPGGIAEIVQVARFAADALNIVYRVHGRVGERLLYRGEETGFEFIEAGRSYAFDADGGLLRLASEAYRIASNSDRASANAPKCMAVIPAKRWLARRTRGLGRRSDTCRASLVSRCIME